MTFRPKRPGSMRVYQRWTSDVIQKKKEVLLVIPVGGGKTVSTLDAIVNLIRDRKVKRVLVIAPLRVAEEVWPEEIQGWTHLWGLRYSVITGSAKGRMFALHTPADVYIVNRENVPWLWKTMKSEGLQDFDMLVIDESTLLADGKKRTPIKKGADGERISGGMLSRFGAVVNFSKRAKRIVELTGTVAPNGLMSLWGQIYPLDFGERLGETKEDFEGRWFESDYMGYKKSPRKGAFEDIMEKVSDIMIAPDISEHIKKIPVRFNPIWVRLSREEMARYKAFERELYESETDIEAISQGVLTNKLCQFSNGSLYDEHGNDKPIHDHKLHALEDLVDELNGERLLVAYSYKFDLDRIRKRYKKAVVLNESPGAYKAWNRGEIDMLLAHPACLHPDTLVLTEHRNWVKILDVRYSDRVFDGVEFVSHRGCVLSGIRPVIEWFGITSTPDHGVLVGDTWVEAQHVRDTEGSLRKARYGYAGNDGRISALPSMRPAIEDPRAERSEEQPGRPETLREVYRDDLSSDDRDASLPHLERHAGALRGSEQSELRTLRRSGHLGRFCLAKLRGVLGRYAGYLRGRPHDRARGQLRQLLQGELPLGYEHGAAGQQEIDEIRGVSGRNGALGRVLSTGGGVARGGQALPRSAQDGRRGDEGISPVDIPAGTSISCAVYDLVDCGPRHRFAIRNDAGDVFIVHNSAGHGLNLQFGGHNCCWYGFNWSVELWLQFNGRLPRTGQANDFVTIHTIQTHGTVDETMHAKMVESTATQDEITAAVMQQISGDVWTPARKPRRAIV